MPNRSNPSRKDNSASNKESRLTKEEMLKEQIAQQTKQIYKLYERIEELNEILKGRNRKQQENLQECNS